VVVYRRCYYSAEFVTHFRALADVDIRKQITRASRKRRAEWRSVLPRDKYRRSRCRVNKRVANAFPLSVPRSAQSSMIEAHRYKRTALHAFFLFRFLRFSRGKLTRNAWQVHAAPAGEQTMFPPFRFFSALLIAFDPTSRAASNRLKSIPSNR